jgi:hypothetical protein
MSDRVITEAAVKMFALGILSPILLPVALVSAAGRITVEVWWWSITPLARPAVPKDPRPSRPSVTDLIAGKGVPG